VLTDTPPITLPGELRAEPPHFKPRGSNQIGMRQYNERVVLQAIRLHGNVPKAELSRLTHLSTQTVSLIIDRLYGDGLVLKQDPVRGKVGQPSVPIALNPDGAFSIGIKIGRRSCDILLLDFCGQVRERASVSYDFPDPEVLFGHVQKQLTVIAFNLGTACAERIVGIGIAAPFSLGGWQNLLGVSIERSRAWDAIDIEARVQAMTPIPVQMVKDTAAACVAELVAGRGRNVRSFVYLFIDTFIGGGVVLDSHWRSGLHGNAGAIASMPLHAAQAGQAAPAQVLSVASLYQLEQHFTQAGLDASACYDDRAMHGQYAQYTELWIVQASSAIALVIQNSACVLDMDAVIIDGLLSRSLLTKLRAAIGLALRNYSWEGLSMPQVLIGAIGADARAIGGGLLPLYSSFAPDRELFLKLDRVS
jgi:predicted NBD/HSP70 family sugar kinase